MKTFERVIGVLLFIVGITISLFLFQREETVKYETDCQVKEIPLYGIYAHQAEEMFSTQYKLKSMCWKDGKLSIVWTVVDKKNKYKDINNKKLQKRNKDLCDDSVFLIRESFDWLKKAIKNQQWLDQRGYDHFEDARDEMGKPFWLRKVPKK